MSEDRGIRTLLEEVRRKAAAVSRFCRGEGRDQFKGDADWPRQAEIALIEELIVDKAKEVIGQTEISNSHWSRCHPFARKVAAPWLDIDKQENESWADAQKTYEYGESKYFEAVVLWVDHTVDYLIPARDRD